MKNKLSREELLICLDKVHGLMQPQAYEQIKSLLTPIPEEKLEELIKGNLKELQELIECGWEWDDTAVANRAKQMLKEYEKLK